MYNVNIYVSTYMSIIPAEPPLLSKGTKKKIALERLYFVSGVSFLPVCKYLQSIVLRHRAQLKCSVS